MTINDLKNLFEDLCNKNQIGGYTKFFSLYSERAQLEVVDAIIGSTIKNTKKGILINQNTKDALDSISTGTFITIPNTGFYDLASIINYRNFSALTAKVQNKIGDLDPKNYTVRVKVLDDSQVWFYTENSIYQASKSNPVCNFTNNGIQFYPVNLQSAYLRYYFTPNAPVWGSTYSLVNAEMITPISAPSVNVGDIIALTGIGTGGSIQVTKKSGNYVDNVSIYAAGTAMPGTSFQNIIGIGTIQFTARQTYDSTTSTQLALPDFLHMDILKIMMGYCGIKIRDQELYQAAMAEENRTV